MTHVTTVIYRHFYRQMLCSAIKFIFLQLCSVIVLYYDYIVTGNRRQGQMRLISSVGKGGATLSTKRNPANLFVSPRYNDRHISCRTPQIDRN